MRRLILLPLGLVFAITLVIIAVTGEFGYPSAVYLLYSGLYLFLDTDSLDVNIGSSIEEVQSEGDEKLRFVLLGDTGGKLIV